MSAWIDNVGPWAGHGQEAATATLRDKESIRNSSMNLLGTTKGGWKDSIRKGLETISFWWGGWGVGVVDGTASGSCPVAGCEVAVLNLRVNISPFFLSSSRFFIDCFPIYFGLDMWDYALVPIMSLKVLAASLLSNVVWSGGKGWRQSEREVSYSLPPSPIVYNTWIITFTPHILRHTGALRKNGYIYRGTDSSAVTTTLKPDVHLSNIYKFSSYLTGNTLRLHNKAQPVNAV
jgi:hypothetical protein